MEKVPRVRTSAATTPVTVEAVTGVEPYEAAAAVEHHQISTEPTHVLSWRELPHFVQTFMINDNLVTMPKS